MSNSDNLYKRFNKAVNRKRQWENLYRQALKFTSPQRSNMYDSNEAPNYIIGDSNEGANPTTSRGFICDSIGELNAESFVANLVHTLTPPNKKWAKLMPSDIILDENNKKLLREQLEKITDILFSYINNSNLYSQLPSAFLDLVAGTGALMIVENPNTESIVEPVKYVAIPLTQLYLEESSHGDISSVFRQQGVVGREIYNVWPGAKLSYSLSDLIASDPEKKHVFVEATTPSTTFVSRMEDGRKVQKPRKSYLHQVMHKATKEIILTKHIDYFPFIVFRWSVAPEEIYGRGVATFCLPDLKTLNILKMRMIQRADKEAMPMAFIDRSRIGDLSRLSGKSGEAIPVRDFNQGLPIQYLQMQGNFSIVSTAIQEITKRVNEAMFAHPIGEIDAAVKTAQEISIRKQEESKRLGSSCERIKYECLNNIIKTTLFILAKRGVFDELFSLTQFSNSTLTEDIILDIQNSTYIKYESPYTSAQGAEDATITQNFLGILAQFFGQDAAKLIKPFNVIQRLAEFLGVKEEMLLTQEEIENLFKSMSEASDVQQEMLEKQL